MHCYAHLEQTPFYLINFIQLNKFYISDEGWFNAIYKENLIGGV